MAVWLDAHVSFNVAERWPAATRPSGIGMLLGGVLAVRLAYLWMAPLDLCPDEAYYWDWSRQLDWGYYSKPPMIAWIIACATYLVGNSEAAIRLPAVVLGTAGLWPVYALGRSLFSARAGFWSVAAVVCTPGMAALSLLMTIDAPFLCAWAFAIWCLWELFGTGTVRWRWLPAAVLATGLGLLSKQTMLAVFPLVVAWLMTDVAGRRLLRGPAVWLWMALSSLCLVPVAWWNAQHGWITLQHTREHFQSRSMSWLGHVLQSLEFWGSQLGIVSPINGGLMAVLGCAALLMFRALDRRLRFLACFSVLPLLGVAALSLWQRVQPNWPAAFHLTAFLLLGAWACGEWQVAPWFDRQRRVFPVGLAVGAALVAGVYAVPFLVPQSSLAGGRLDATARLRGWDKLGRGVGDALQAFPEPSRTLVIAATSRGPVSALAYYLPGQPRVYRWNPTGLVESQHEVWGGPRDIDTADALIVTQQNNPVPAELAAAFDDVTPCGMVQVSLGGYREERLSLWRGAGFRGWPEHPRRLVERFALQEERR